MLLPLNKFQFTVLRHLPTKLVHIHISVQLHDNKTDKNK